MRPLNLLVRQINSDLKTQHLHMIYATANGAIFSIESILVIYLGASAVIKGEMSAGVLLTFLAYKSQLARASPPGQQILRPQDVGLAVGPGLRFCGRRARSKLWKLPTMRMDTPAIEPTLSCTTWHSATANMKKKSSPTSICVSARSLSAAIGAVWLW
jgi:ATP-binding cassette subfamily B protein RaxB